MFIAKAFDAAGSLVAEVEAGSWSTVAFWKDAMVRQGFTVRLFTVVSGSVKSLAAAVVLED